ncbi:MAG TPA: hypothetical protein ENN39_08095 [Desulfonatronum sp.]|nr:hypothetical protein [Desulfonatronum sp.]
MTNNTIQAGSSIQSICRKCKGATEHHVVVMVEGTIAKVQCKVCGGRHAYRSPVEKPKTVSPRPAKNKKLAPVPAKKPSEVLEHWTKMINEASGEPILPYAMDCAFQTGDVIDHQRFGLGYVQKFMKPNVIEVLFKDSIKNLRCNK